MRRHRAPILAVLAVILAASSILACRGSDEPYDAWAEWQNWKISFQNEQAAEYGGSACGPGSMLYCKSWHAERSVFSGNIHRKKDGTWILELARQNYPGTERIDPTRVFVWLKEDGYCAGYGLSFSSVSDSISGTFSYDRDCHGDWRTGTFSAHR